jgi:hypothetical protein
LIPPRPLSHVRQQEPLVLDREISLSQLGLPLAGIAPFRISTKVSQHPQVGDTVQRKNDSIRYVSDSHQLTRSTSVGSFLLHPHANAAVNVVPVIGGHRVKNGTPLRRRWRFAPILEARKERRE